MLSLHSFQNKNKGTATIMKTIAAELQYNFDVRIRVLQGTTPQATFGPLLFKIDLIVCGMCTD